MSRPPQNKKATSAGKKPEHDKAQTTGLGLVTGGIGGIGTAICKQLAKDSKQIVATYIAAESEYARKWKFEREQEGFDIELYECDVTDFNACKKMATAIEKQHGRIDILVNCAGITRDGLLKKMHEKQWQAVINTNLDSVFNVTRNLIDGMIGFTRSLALELATTGITVNCVCPGYVNTRLVEAIREDIKQGIIAQIPMRRLAKTEEIAKAVAFLASKDSGYITGTEIAVNGGLWLG